MATRREFLRQGLAGALGTSALGAATPSCGAPPPSHQRRWRAALGLNGFMSSERRFQNSFPIWEVVDFARRSGFEGVELVEGWPKGGYPEPDETERLRMLRSFYERYHLKIFSIQTSAGGAFRRDASARKTWLREFRARAMTARRLGCECIGIWPGGGLDGQSHAEALARLIESLREVARIVSDAELLASVEIEPPFAFRTIEDLVAIVDGVNHPLVKGMYDPSHFDLMNGGTGKPEELLETLGVHRVGYIHLTDTDGTLFEGTSRHLPCGDGHVDIRRSLEILWGGGYEGWIMIDPWMTRDPYEACLKGREAIASAQRELFGT